MFIFLDNTVEWHTDSPGVSVAPTARRPAAPQWALLNVLLVAPIKTAIRQGALERGVKEPFYGQVRFHDLVFRHA